MKKDYMFVSNQIVVRTERNLQLLVKNERSGNFLAMDEEGNLYSNNAKGMADDLRKEDFRRCPEAWIRAQGLIAAMIEFGVKGI